MNEMLSVSISFETFFDEVFSGYASSDHFDKMIEQLPSYDPAEPMSENKIALLKQIKKESDILQYEIQIKDGTYSEWVHIKGTDWQPANPTHSILESDEAHKFMHRLLQNKNFLPCALAFQIVRRLVTPAQMFVSLMAQTETRFQQDVNDITNGNDETSRAKEYVYNTNDTPEQYSPKALAKLFPPLPEYISNPKYALFRGMDTPVKSVLVRIKKDDRKDDFQLNDMRFYSQPIDTESLRDSGWNRKLRDDMAPYGIIQFGFQ
eukprot:GDKI01011222.1.p1 GENE.GDKI01011222.1~~GDKI01011222.1.p1  ORF type:complete len:263 (-),score=34.46 GDKI01011222.1:429-1217(-)